MHRYRAHLIAALVAAAGVLAAGAAAAPTGRQGTRNLSVPHLLGSVLPKVKRHTDVPVLLPRRIPVDRSFRRFSVSGIAGKDGYDLSVGVGRHCNGANACFIAAFAGRRGERPVLRRRVRLRGGRRGYFKPTTCGASCSPPEVQWVQGGVLYDLQLKGLTARHERPAMIALANSAIGAGPR